MRKCLNLLLLLVVCTYLYGQDAVISDISAAFKSGYIEVIGKHSSEQMKVSISDKENNYSKEQAMNVVSSFLKDNKPLTYAIIHTGNKDGATFVIGNLKTDKGSFRIFYLLKDSKIQQIRIENS